MAKRTAKELWDKLVDEAGEELVERAASVSAEQATKELAAAGFDVKAEEAEAEAFLKDLASGALEKRAAEKAEAKAEKPEAKTEKKAESAPVTAPDTSGTREKAPAPGKVERIEPRKRQPLPAWLMAAAAGVIAGGGVVYSAMGPTGVSKPPPPGPSAADLAAATDLRREATAACDASKWAECLADLDQARALDPDGDEGAPVKAMRDRAIRNIRGKP